MLPNLTVVLISSSFALLGVLVGGFISWMLARQRERSESQRQAYDLGVRFGLANYDSAVKYAEGASRELRTSIHIPPLKAFVIQGIEIMQALNNPRLSREEKLALIRDAEAFSERVAQAAKR